MSKNFFNSEKGLATPDNASEPVEIGQVSEENEIFKSDGEVNFRTVGWVRAAVIFLKSACSRLGNMHVFWLTVI